MSETAETVVPSGDTVLLEPFAPDADWGAQAREYLQRVKAQLFEQHRHSLKEALLLIVEGKVTHDEFSGGLRVSADKLYDLNAARNRFARGVRLTCNGQSSAQKLKELLAPYRNGPCPVSVVYHNHRVSCEIDLGDAWRVNLNDNLLQSLAAWLSEDNVKVVYRA